MSWAAAEADRQARSALSQRPRAQRRELELALAGRTNDVRWETFAVGMVFFMGITILVVIGTRVWNPIAFRGEAPQSPSVALFAMWQVLGAAFGIAFPLLLLFAQFVGEPGVLAKSAAQVLIRRSYADITGAFLLIAVTVVGGCALWLQSDSTVLICFAMLFAPGIVLLGLAYLRAIQLVLDPLRLRAVSAQILKRQLRASIASAWLYDRAAQLLIDAFNARDVELLHSRSVPTRDAANWQVVLDGRDAFVSDVDPDRLAGVLNSLTTQTAPAGNIPAAAVALAANKPKVVLGAWPGERLSRDSALLAIRDFALTDRQIVELRSLVTSAIEVRYAPA